MHVNVMYASNTDASATRRHGNRLRQQGKSASNVNRMGVAQGWWK